MPSTPRILTTQLRVRSYEMDSFGHANNAIYLQYLEAARCDYMRQVGIEFNCFQQWGAFPAVVEAHLKYHQSVVTDDLLEIRGWFTHWKSASFNLEYEIRKEDQSKVLSANLKFAFVSLSGKIVRVPPAFRDPFL